MRIWLRLRPYGAGGLTGGCSGAPDDPTVRAPPVIFSRGERRPDGFGHNLLLFAGRGKLSRSGILFSRNRGPHDYDSVEDAVRGVGEDPELDQDFVIEVEVRRGFPVVVCALLWIRRC